MYLNFMQKKKIKEKTFRGAWEKKYYTGNMKITAKSLDFQSWLRKQFSFQTLRHFIITIFFLFCVCVLYILIPTKKRKVPKHAGFDEVCVSIMTGVKYVICWKYKVPKTLKKIRLWVILNSWTTSWTALFFATILRWRSNGQSLSHTLHITLWSWLAGSTYSRARLPPYQKPVQ